MVTEHAADPLSGDFSSSSPASERSSTASSSSSSPLKHALFRLQGADASPEKTRGSYNFSEDDLFTVLYGYSTPPRRTGAMRGTRHLQGAALPEDPGRSSAYR